MHVGIADQRSEGPKPRRASDGVSLDMTDSNQAADQRRPGRRDIPDELRIERAQRENANAAELTDAVESRHFQESLTAEVENISFDAKHRKG